MNKKILLLTLSLSVEHVKTAQIRHSAHTIKLVGCILRPFPSKGLLPPIFHDKNWSNVSADGGDWKPNPNIPLEDQKPVVGQFTNGAQLRLTVHAGMTRQQLFNVIYDAAQLLNVPHAGFFISRGLLRVPDIISREWLQDAWPPAQVIVFEFR